MVREPGGMHMGVVIRVLPGSGLVFTRVPRKRMLVTLCVGMVAGCMDAFIAWAVSVARVVGWYGQSRCDDDERRGAQR